ncbi:MAG: UDP-N-acetylmuramoyl-L-alanyl-D-glutamate--2,6-diaminopimelate ligase [Oscillospiraceae bacterium]|nr:UDP-N-acetylmuramoyl-L-alanyl-D-glutamate--2,6-diaminopimelate ligase [Oscillospiraceae bacterium]
MKLRELLLGLDIMELHADDALEITGICHDSRKTQPGDLFVAISGFAADGHRFIPMAQEKGAAVVLCEHAPETGDYILVKNSRLALARLGANWFGHPADKMTMIGITGTNGKTTSTYLLKHILEKECGAKVGLVGTIQNMIGEEVLETERTTPESFELQELFKKMYDAGCTHVIMEVSSHALVLDRVAGIRFKTGLFTNLSQDHLDFHKTMEEYRQAKALLFGMCDCGAVNFDDAAADAMVADAKCPVLTYSADGRAADLMASHIVLEPGCVSFDASCKGEKAAMRLQIPGKFSVYNALGVCAVALLLGLSLEQIADALADASGVRGRAEVVPTFGRDYTVIVDYSHTPDSLENILRTVRESCKGRVVAVFGCGGDRDPIKRPIMGRVGGELADFVIVTSDNPRTEDPMKIVAQVESGVEQTGTPYVVIEDRRKAIAYSLDHAGPGDVIVLAGKGHETYQEIGHEKFHLDDREEVIKHLQKKG